MSLWSRIANVLRGDRLSREIDEELESHIAEAIEQGRDPAAARVAFGSSMRLGEQSRDLRLNTWLDSLRADIVFGWRRLRKNKVTSAAAVLSLGLAIGACTSAFRLIDALLLRPLPVAEPERLYAVCHESIDGGGQRRTIDSYEYPMFRQMRASVKGHAELIAISYAYRTDLTYGSDQEMERAYRQYVSGWMFSSFGLRPAMGRLFTENDDLTPKAHPYAVLSHDYWTRRFGQDPKAIGREFRIGSDRYTIIGVSEERFTGAETGAVTDIFVPTMMNPEVTQSDSSWIRMFVRMNPGVAVEPVRDRLRVPFTTFRQERARAFFGMPKGEVDKFLRETLRLESAAAGVSRMQRDYRRSLAALAVLVFLVLLIACANVGNLLTAQAAGRAREMALRVSIGAGRWRLLQLVLVESAMLGFLASAAGGAFAWWSAPMVVGMINPPDNPARLFLPADWRLFGFGLALAFGVTFLFGLAPALRSSAVKPVNALRGGADPGSQRRLMRALIAVQVAFCVLVHFAAGLFTTTFNRLSHQPTGFSAERLLALETVAQPAQQPVYWSQLVESLKVSPGVETAALASFPLLSRNATNGFISINGAPPTQTLTYFLSVSPGWMAAMQIPVIQGRDFVAADSSPGTAMVNLAFAKEYFHGANPIGRSFERASNRTQFRIIGLVGDARYRNIRDRILPTVYVPFQSINAAGVLQPRGSGTIIVRTSGSNPLAPAQALRRQISQARPEFRVSNIRTQTEINQSHTIRERLLAILALFFAIVALLLAAIGLYGVLTYSVLQRRREIGIRMAIGAQATSIVRLVTAEVFAMVLVGAVAGLGLGMASVRYVETLFYQVKPTELGMLALPAMTIVAAAVLAALPAVIRAVRLDPVKVLRAD